MIRRLILTGCISLFAAHHNLHAQPSAAKPTTAKADTIGSKFIGTWEGSMFTDHAGETPMRLVISRAPALKIELMISVNGEAMPAGPAANINFDGNSVSWTQNLMEQDCKASGLLIDGTLKGEVVCGPMSGTYIAKKK